MPDPAFPPAGPAADAAFAAQLAGALADAGPDPHAPGLWRALGAGGVLAGLVGADGSRPDLRRLARMVAALDEAYPPGLVLSVCVQVATVLPVLAEASRRTGDPGAEIASEVRAAALSGTGMVALAVTDADAAGSDVTALGCAMRPDGDGLVLSGGKRWITNATVARYALVLARRRPGNHFTDFSWVLVPLTAPGVDVTPADTPLFAGAGIGDLRFDGVALPAAYVVGGAGRGLASFTRHVATERICGALWARALLRGVLERTGNWLADRTVGGVPLAANAVTRQRMGRALVAYAQLAAVCRSIVDDAGADAVTAMVAKVTAAEVAERVLSECAALTGADGFAAGGAHVLRAEAAMLGTAGGTVELMLAGIAEHAADLLGTHAGTPASLLAEVPR